MDNATATWTCAVSLYSQVAILPDLALGARGRFGQANIGLLG